MEPEQLAKYMESRRDGKVREEGWILKVRKKKLTGEGPDFPSKELPDVGPGILMWENEPILNSCSLLCLLCLFPQCQGMGRLLRGWGGLLGVADSSQQWLLVFRGCPGTSGVHPGVAEHHCLVPLALKLADQYTSLCTEIAWNIFSSFHPSLLTFRAIFTMSGFHRIGGGVRACGDAVFVLSSPRLCCPILTAPGPAGAAHRGSLSPPHRDSSVPHVYPSLRGKCSQSSNVQGPRWQWQVEMGALVLTQHCFRAGTVLQQREISLLIGKGSQPKPQATVRYN